ncbi:Na+/H+ antiporter NhaC [Aurantivibrio infirmus]
MNKQPSLLHALVCFGGIFLCISFGLFYFQVSLHALMFVCLLWASFHSYLLGYKFVEIREMMNRGITKALPAIYIFILIGMVIASFMQSGTIASLLFYGLQFLKPSIFLVASLVLCSFMSVATGTSWGTVGTLGVVLLAIGDTLGMPLPLVAGVIISGATFGDKLSPVSDTTNLAAMSAGTSLYRHIYSMLFTTIPTFIVVTIILIIYGFLFDGNASSFTELEAMLVALDDLYVLNPLITFIPIIVMVFCSLRRLSAEVSMSLSVVAATLIAIIVQQQPITESLNALWSNTAPDSGIASLNSLLGRGGISSMSWTLLISIMALAMGGILNGAGFLQVLLEGILVRLRRTGSIVATTIGAGVIGNMGMGEAYITIILNSQLFKPVFKREKIDKAVLSRSVEEGATMTTGLIPWTTAGAFYASTLMVPVVEYAPYAFLNYLNPLISIVLAFLGWGLLGGRSKACPERNL